MIPAGGPYFLKPTIRRNSYMLTKLSGGVRTAQEALFKCGLLWSVAERPVFDTEHRVIPTHVALHRSDTGAQLSIVKKSYRWIDNSVFGFFDCACKRHHAEYVGGGLLNGGRRVFLVVRLGKSEIQRGDEICNDLLLCNSFDSTSALFSVTIPWRMICSNQMSRALREGTKNLSIRHTSGIEERAIEAFRLYDMSTSSFSVFINQSRLLARKHVTDLQVKQFLDQLMPLSESTRSKNARERVIELFHSGKGNKGQSAFDLVSGYVEHLDHDGGGDQDSLISSRLFGFRASQKSKALDLAMAL
jgi:phage/plasmid-like protein (TIGR03299 family)